MIVQLGRYQEDIIVKVHEDSIVIVKVSLRFKKFMLVLGW